MSLVRWVPLSRKTHIPSDMCYPTQETHISSDITSDMCSPIRETHTISDMGIPGRGTHISRDCSRVGKTHSARDMC